MSTVVPNSSTENKTEQNQKLSTGDNDNNNDDEDHVTLAIRKTGCYQLHEKLQECYIDKKDWRKCTNEMQAFRHCMQNIQRCTTSSSKQ